MSGWVRLSRDFFDDEAFPTEPLTEREAYLWLIMRAAWTETSHRIGNILHQVERGSLFVTLRELRDAWRWGSDKRVRGFLEMLENGRKIGRTADAGKTLITLYNYSKYQDVAQSSDARVDAPKTHGGRTADALKKQENNKQEEDTSLRSVSARGSRLPEDWQPSIDGMQFAIHLLGEQTDTEVLKFRDFWHAKAGKDAAKLDWSATWRNWCRNANPQPKAQFHGRPAKPSILDAGMDALRDFQSRREAFPLAIAHRTG